MSSARSWGMSEMGEEWVCDVNSGATDLRQSCSWGVAGALKCSVGLSESVYLSTDFPVRVRSPPAMFWLITV